MRLLGEHARNPAGPSLDVRLGAECLPHLDQLVWRQIDSLYYLQFAPTAPQQRVYDKLWRAQRQALCELLGRLHDEEVSPIVFKGAELVQRHYGDHSIGLLRDFDILVERIDLGKTARVLRQLGYGDWAYDRERGGWRDRDPLEAARATLQHYELMPLSRMVPLELDAEEYAAAVPLCRKSSPLVLVDGGCSALIDVDVHHGLGRNIEIEDLFARSINSIFAHARTLSAADHLWFMVKRSYVEVAQGERRSLRPFAYLAPMVRDPDLDWGAVLQLAEQYEACPALHYWLTFLDSLAGGDLLPAQMLAQLHPSRRKRHGDLGWQLALMFDAVEPLPWGLPRVSAAEHAPVSDASALMSTASEGLRHGKQ